MHFNLLQRGKMNPRSRLATTAARIHVFGILASLALSSGCVRDSSATLPEKESVHRVVIDPLSPDWGGWCKNDFGTLQYSPAGCPTSSGWTPTLDPPPIPPAYNPAGGGGGAPEGDSPVDALSQGPGAWILCTGAGLVAIGGTVVTYAVWRDYSAKVTTLFWAQNAVRNYQGTSAQEEWALKNAESAAETQLTTATIELAGSAGVSVGSFLLVVGACSPSVVLPTP